MKYLIIFIFFISCYNPDIKSKYLKAVLNFNNKNYEQAIDLFSFVINKATDKTIIIKSFEYCGKIYFIKNDLIKFNDTYLEFIKYLKSNNFIDLSDKFKEIKNSELKKIIFNSYYRLLVLKNTFNENNKFFNEKKVYNNYLSYFRNYIIDKKLKIFIGFKILFYYQKYRKYNMYKKLLKYINGLYNIKKCDLYYYDKLMYLMQKEQIKNINENLKFNKFISELSNHVYTYFVTNKNLFYAFAYAYLKDYNNFTKYFNAFAEETDLSSKQLERIFNNVMFFKIRKSVKFKKLKSNWLY